ncbi:MAG: alanyl-tRNA synthetase [Flavobacteriales bacterium]|jgi:alanyl-tRNA synthetase
MKSAVLRQKFLEYFKSHNHEIVSSSSLIPGNDPTLLFTNAGMVQFKDVFLGQDKRAYSRATSSQKCVRAGGKHNDLENVGYTARHHTFFEMLGNFSFGDYFKRDAIQLAWTFLTEVLDLPEEKLWITVHTSDDEAADIWIKEMGASPDRFSRLDEDNFWQMGDTGPCGPSSEIFYDHGADVPGGPPGSPDDDGDRYIEIWNLVFMQYERQADTSLVPLPKPSVDTGMGLERIAAVLQGVHSNYEIDLFQALLAAAQKACGSEDADSKSLRVIADHIRSCSFLISDGVLPSNEGRGYVLRRIIRRAIRHGHKLGQTALFFHTIVAALVEQMGEAYPELVSGQAQIEKVIKAEEVQFAKTLDNGLSVLDVKLKNLQGSVIPGDVVFALYDTYGFPVDLTNDIARERELSLDMEGYQTLMTEQRKKSKESGSFKLDYTKNLSIDGETEFVGYEQLNHQALVTGLFIGEASSKSLNEGDEGLIVLDKTPFYGESGGQVGDAGFIESTDGKARFEVLDCQKSGINHIHVGRVVSGVFNIDTPVTASVDASIRTKTAQNHSATHLLHAALRKVLGDHVSQKGSLCDSERLRFDFSHTEAVSKKQLQEVETLVNQQVQHNSAVTTDVCGMDDAKEKGAMALFGEKYGDQVRVLSMGDDAFSVELCGGTHVAQTGDVGLIHITAESGVAAGVRRLEAITGETARIEYKQMQATIESAAAALKSTPSKLLEKLEQLNAQSKKLEKELAQVNAKLSSASADEWLAEAFVENDVKVLIKAVEGIDAKSLRDLVDKLKSKLGTSAVLVASAVDGKIAICAGVSKDATKIFQAGTLVKELASRVDGKGGGRPDMAQGGGTNIDALPGAIEAVKQLLTGK